MKVRWARVLAVLGVLAVVCAATALLGVMYFVPTRSVTGPIEDIADIAREQAQPVADNADVSARASREGRATEAALRNDTDAGAPDADAAAPSAGDGPADDEGLTPFRVLTLQYTPYMATLALMDARGYMADVGYDLQLVDVYDPAVDLDEAGQCAALQSGSYDALATTLDATRKCGTGVTVGIPIGQSAGNDAIVVKPGVESWNDVFEHAVAFTSQSVSEYMACFASHTANAPMRLPLGYDDAAEAVDAWLNAGAEQDIQSVVAWEPEVSRALQAAPDSRVILSSDDVRILWDVIEFPTAATLEDPARYGAFTRAYYRALRDLAADPESALAAITAWAGDDEGRQALLTTTDPQVFRDELDNEAFATLRDAAILMDDREALLNRLEEASFYWQYCDESVPEVEDLSSLIAPEFVLEAREDAALVGPPGEQVSSKAFQVTDFTNAAAVTDAQIEEARVLFQTGVDIEFLPNRTDFRDPSAANATLRDAVRFLRTCQDCVLEVQGGAAYPGERVCPGCRPEDSDALAIDRGRRVYDELRLRFDVPEAQLRFVDEPNAPQFPGSNNEQELRQDRRTFLTGYQLSGR